MHKLSKYIMIAAVTAMAGIVSTGCGNSQSSASEEATTEAVVITQTIPKDEHNAQFMDSLRLFMDFSKVMEEDIAALKEKKEAKAAAAKEASTQASTELAKETSTEEGKEKAEEASTEVKAEESSTEVKPEEASTQASKETSSEISTESKETSAAAESASEASTEETAKVPEQSWKEIKSLAYNKLTQGFALGEVKDGVYQNSYWGISYPIDESWTVDDRMQMLAFDRIDASSLDTSTLVNILQGVSQFTDCYVTMRDGDATFMVSTLNLANFKSKFQGHKSAQEYFYKKLYYHFKKYGYTDILATKDETKIGKMVYEVLDIQLKDGDTPYFIKAMFAKKDNFLNIILFTSKNENVNDILVQTLAPAK